MGTDGKIRQPACWGRGSGCLGCQGWMPGLPRPRGGVQPRGDQRSRSGEPESPLAAGSLGSSLECVCVCARARAPAGRENSPAPSLTWSWLEVKWLSQQLSAHPSLGVGASIRIAPNLPVLVAENPAQDLPCLPEALGGGVAGRLSGPDR